MANEKLSSSSSRMCTFGGARNPRARFSLPIGVLNYLHDAESFRLKNFRTETQVCTSPWYIRYRRHDFLQIWRPISSMQYPMHDSVHLPLWHGDGNGPSENDPARSHDALLPSSGGQLIVILLPGGHQSFSSHHLLSLTCCGAAKAAPGNLTTR